MNAVWHDLECGGYDEDLEVWRDLAGSAGDRVLDIGAGTGRTAIDLARAGFSVTAVDNDEELLAVLRERAAGLPVTAVVADARTLALGRRFPLGIVPMQTVQLLGGAAGRRPFLERAREHLTPGGRLAIALAEELEPFEVTVPALGPLPDIREIDGVVYSSRPTAVRAAGDGYVLERRRDTVWPDGRMVSGQSAITLDRLDAVTLEREAGAAGLAPAERIEIPPTDEYVGTTVVVLRA